MKVDREWTNGDAVWKINADHDTAVAASKTVALTDISHTVSTMEIQTVLSLDDGQRHALHY